MSVLYTSKMSVNDFSRIIIDDSKTDGPNYGGTHWWPFWPDQATGLSNKIWVAMIQIIVKLITVTMFKLMLFERQNQCSLTNKLKLSIETHVAGELNFLFCKSNAERASNHSLLLTKITMDISDLN